MQFGQYGEPSHTIVHLSDTHFLGDRLALFDQVDSDATLGRLIGQLAASGTRPDAIVVTGDLADRGESAAYARLRAELEPFADQVGAELVWVMGNHDDRPRFRAQLLDESAHGAPVDSVVDLSGLRLVVLDSTVPGYDHGELSADQLAWLREVLAAPAPHGSVIAMHHPPVPIAVEAMTILELQDQDAFARTLEGTDVRAILAGHLHYSCWSTFAGIPVSVAAATCYALDLAAPPRIMRGIDGGQAFHLVHVYGDRVVNSVVPIGEPETVYEFGSSFLDEMALLDPAGRRESFGRRSPAAE